MISQADMSHRYAELALAALKETGLAASPRNYDGRERQSLPSEG